MTLARRLMASLRPLRPAPFQDPPDTPAPLPQRPEPVRGFAWPQGEPVRRAGMYRDVAPETESERAYVVLAFVLGRVSA